MPQRKKKDPKDIRFQNISVQDHYEDEEAICECFKNCKPPPPPGGEDLWELQFCRWWGWNWVKKRQLENENKKEPKNGFKELCNCLRFKKGEAKVTTLRNLYNTPSNSVVVQKTYSCEVAEIEQNSFLEAEIERNVSHQGRRYNEEKNKTIESWIQTKDTFSSSEECFCCRSNTDESVEYIKISCCPCCHHKGQEQQPEKCNCETQTSEPVIEAMFTSTKQYQENMRYDKKDNTTEPMKKHKKKRKRLICCCCSMQHNCCKCRYQLDGKEAKNDRYLQEKSSKYETKESTKSPKDNECSKCTQVKGGWPSYVPLNLTNQYPYDMMLYYNDFSKFVSPQNDFKLYKSQSDSIDKSYRIKNMGKFASPISGEVYNLTPVKVNNFGIKPTILPDPIDVSADLDHLKKLENEFQLDRESHIMLDAVCDAILSNNTGRTISSTILNEVTYSFKDAEACNINRIFDRNNIYPDFKKDMFEGINCSNISHGNLESNYYNSSALNTFLNNENQRELNSNVDDIIKSLVLNCEKTPEQLLLNKTKDNKGYKWKTQLGSNMDTSEFLKLDLKQEKDLNQFNNLHIDNTSSINNIFNKIEEIILKTKINDWEIQNVLNNIPNRIFQHLSSEKITSESNFTSKNSLTEGLNFNSTNLSRDGLNLISNISGSSDTSQQNHGQENTHVENLGKLKKTHLAEAFTDENESKMVPSKKRKKNPKGTLLPNRKIDKFKANKQK